MVMRGVGGSQLGSLTTLSLALCVSAWAWIGASPAGAATVEKAPREAGEEQLAAAAEKQRKARLQASTALTLPTSDAMEVALEVDKLTLFGDSYTALGRTTRFLNWAEQLKAEGDVATLASFAKSGATAATVGTNHFKKQFNAFAKTNATFDADDVTVVYLGYNDVNKKDIAAFADLSKSKADYTLYVNRLINKGVNKNGAQLLLAAGHNWQRNPAQGATDTGPFKDRTLQWRSFVSGLANSKSNTVFVDLYTVFENIFDNPGAFGLTNITTANKQKSQTTFLYDDPNHFGRRGQELIKQVFEDHLTRATRVAQTLSVSDTTALQRQQDQDRGLAVNLAALAGEEEQLGLTAFPVGVAALAETDEWVLSDNNAFAAFDEAYKPDARDGGVGFNYELGGGTRLGFVISSYEESVRDSQALSTSKGSVESDAVSFYAQSRLGALELGSRFVYSNDTHEHRLYDELVDQGSRASFGGSTLELSQRAGLPVRRQGMTITPWASLTYRSQEVDSFSMTNPYVSDVTYAVAPISETEAALGLDVASDPMALTDSTTLVVFGGLSYAHSLARDDYDVRVQEAAVSNYTQRETIERPELRTLGLNLGAQMVVGERLALGLGLGVTADPEEGMAEAARVSLNYRF
jgi:phospholipase/lecithinase/hemolysin